MLGNPELYFEAINLWAEWEMNVDNLVDFILSTTIAENNSIWWFETKSTERIPTNKNARKIRPLEIFSKKPQPCKQHMKNTENR